MQNLDSLLLNGFNLILDKMHRALECIVNSSIILKSFDKFILFFISLLLIFSSFSSTKVIGVLAILVFLLSFLKLLIVKGEKLNFSFIGLILTLFLIIAFASNINSTLVAKSFHGYFKTLTYFGFYFASVRFFEKNPNKIFWILSLITLVLSFESLVAILQNISGVRQISTWQDVSNLNPEDIISRGYGTLKPYNPNLLAGFLLCGFYAPVYLGFHSLIIKNYKVMTLLSLICLLIISAIFVSGSRGAYLGLFAMCFSIIIILQNIIWKKVLDNVKAKRIFVKLVCSFAGIFALIMAIMPSIIKRILSIFALRQDSSTAFRFNVYNSSIKIFFDNLFLGIGSGNQTFQEIYGLYMISGFDALSTYCVWLEIGVENGILGLILFLCFIITIFYYSMKFIKISKEFRKLAMVGSLLSCIVGVMVHGLFDTVFFRPQIQMLFWINIAILSNFLLQQKEHYDK